MLSCVVNRAEMAVFVFVQHIVRKRFQEGISVKAVWHFFQAFKIFFGFAFQSERLVFRHALYEIFQTRNQQLDDGLRNLEVEQGVAHVHIEQTALPLSDAADFLFADYISAVFFELFGREVGVIVLALAQIVAARSLYPLRQREDVHYACAFDVDDEIDVLVLFECALRALLRLFEGYALEDVVGGNHAEVADALLRFLAQHVGVVVDEVGKAFVCEEASRVPFLPMLAIKAFCPLASTREASSNASSNGEAILEISVS